MAALRKRGNTWTAYWRENGKVVSKTLGTDARMARIKVGEIEKKLMAKRNGLEAEIDWNEFVEKYLNCCKANLAEQTVVRVAVVFRNFNRVTPIKYLSELTPEILEEFKLLRKNSGTQPSTINREITTFKTAMKKAAEWGYASTNIWGVRKMPMVKKRPAFYTEDEIKIMLNTADPFWKLVVLLGFYAGLRKGEMLALQWDHIDFAQHQIKITPTEDWHPKDYEAREVPLHPSLANYLQIWKQLSAVKELTAKILPWDQPSNYFSLRFKRLLKRAEIDRGSLHSLRHTFASHLAMKGIDLYRIGRMMGHSSPTTTQIYAHLLPSSLTEALSKMPTVNVENSGETSN
jgi:integrase